jgi:spore germination protein GerM
MVGLSLIGIMIGVIGYITERKHALRDTSSIWYVEADSGGTEALVRGGKIDAIKHDVKKLVAALNASGKYPGISRTPGNREPNGRPQVKLTKIKNDVAFIEVVNAEYLTQRMGSSGAQAYLASVTFTLTENPRIKKVNFIFEEGDHAMPGIYSRQDFSQYKIVTGGRGR